MPDKAPVVAFDGDEAGHAGSLVLAETIYKLGRECVVTTLPSTSKDAAAYLEVVGPSGLTAWRRGGCLKADVTGLRPEYGANVIVRGCWRAEVAEVLKGKTPDWEAAIQRVVERAVTIRAELPETVRPRFDTEVAKTLAPMVAHAAVQHVGAHPPTVDDDPELEARQTAKAIAHKARSWLDALAERDLGVVDPVLEASLHKRTGETPKVQACIAQRCVGTAGVR